MEQNLHTTDPQAQGRTTTSSTSQVVETDVRLDRLEIAGEGKMEKSLTAAPVADFTRGEQFDQLESGLFLLLLTD